MQDGSLQEKGGINIHTNSFSYDECIFLAHILNIKFKLKVTVVKAGYINQ
jgi:LAGLIDADG DNA endonuclease family